MSSCAPGVIMCPNRHYVSACADSGRPCTNGDGRTDGRTDGTWGFLYFYSLRWQARGPGGMDKVRVSRSCCVDQASTSSSDSLLPARPPRASRRDVSTQWGLRRLRLRVPTTKDNIAGSILEPNLIPYAEESGTRRRCGIGDSLAHLRTASA